MQLRNISIFVLVSSPGDVKAVQNFLWGSFSEIIANNFKLSVSPAHTFEQGKILLGEDSKTKYDLCILEGGLVGKDFALLRQVKENFPDAVIALYSDENKLVSGAVQNGASIVLSPSLTKESYGTSCMLFDCMA